MLIRAAIPLGVSIARLAQSSWVRAPRCVLGNSNLFLPYPKNAGTLKIKYFALWVIFRLIQHFFVCFYLAKASIAPILNIARLAQSAERKALNLVVVGSSPTVGVCEFEYASTLTSATKADITVRTSHVDIALEAHEAPRCPTRPPRKTKIHLPMANGICFGLFRVIHHR